MTSRFALTGAVAASLVAAAVGPADADEDEDADREDDLRAADEGSRWSVTMHGGALLPLSSMDGTHQIGLVAGARIGWTSRIGLGLELSATYSPLSRAPVEEVQAETHYGTLTFGPHFTLGDGLWRLTIGAGGGASGERTRLIQGDVDLTSTQLAPIAEGRAAVELHPIPGGGLVVGGSYTHSFGDDRYRYASLGAGLILTF